MTRALQFVSWFPAWQGFTFRRARRGLRLIYKWFWFIGFWEIRRWNNDTYDEKMAWYMEDKP